MSAAFQTRLLVVTVVLAFLSAAQQSPPSLTASFWSGPQPGSPKLPESGTGLDFALQPATSADGKPTLALMAGGRLSERQADVYGARVGGATHIVAINAASGDVFSQSAERPGAAPLPSIRNRHSETSQTAKATVDSIEIWFNADLRSHLGLPPQAETYRVFLWLDEMTSPLHIAELPAAGAASGSSSAPALDSAGIRFQRSRCSPRARQHALMLRLGTGRHNGIVYGAADPRDLIASDSLWTMLALDVTTHQLFHHSLKVRKSDLTSSEGCFEFKSSLLDLPKEAGGRYLLVAVSPWAISNVVPLQ